MPAAELQLNVGDGWSHLADSDCPLPSVLESQRAAIQRILRGSPAAHHIRRFTFDVCGVGDSGLVMVLSTRWCFRRVGRRRTGTRVAHLGIDILDSGATAPQVAQD